MAIDTGSSTARRDLGIEPPRSPRRQPRPNHEMHAWLFMRISGLALILLVVGHLLIMTVLGGGVHRVNFGFVAGRWSAPFWQLWDLLMLWLAELHGTIGLRTIIEDYAERPRTRLWLKTLLYTSAALVLALGTLVILTFNPTLNT